MFLHVRGHVDYNNIHISTRYTKNITEERSQGVITLNNMFSKPTVTFPTVKSTNVQSIVDDFHFPLNIIASPLLWKYLYNLRSPRFLVYVVIAAITSGKETIS